MEFDIYAYVKAAASTTAVLLPIILAVVTLAGKFGVTGKAQLAVSLVVGALFGSAVQVASVGPPATFVDWVALGIFALIPGLTASGTYETVKYAAEKGSKVNGLAVPSDEGTSDHGRVG